MEILDTPSNLSLRQLRGFYLVAQEGSMTRAATRMHLTISAMSMLVRTLEEELGVRLFERTTRRVELSDAGKQFLPAVRDVFFNLNAGLRALDDNQRRKSTRLSLVTSPLLAASLIPHVIAQFRQQFPNVIVTLVDAPVDQVVSSVRDGRADFGICTSSPGIHDLVSQVLYEDALVLACHKDHPLAQSKELTWTDLIDQSLVLLTPGSGLRKLIDQTMSRVTLQLKPAFEVANIHTAVGMVSAGLGVAVLPAYGLSRADSHGVVAVPLIAPEVTREIVAICTRAQPFSTAAEAFLTHFKKYTAQSSI